MWFSISRFNERPTDSHLTLLVGFTRQPRRNTWFRSMFVKLSTEFSLLELPTFGFYPFHVLSRCWRSSSFRTCAYSLSFIHWWLSANHLQSNPFFDRWCHSSLSYYRTITHPNTTVDRDRCVSIVSLNSGFEHISSWGSNNRVTFNTSKTSLLSVSLKHHSFSQICPLTLIWILQSHVAWDRIQRKSIRLMDDLSLTSTL